MSKRERVKIFKVVQDRYGEWGILDTSAKSREQAFASWGSLYGQLEEIVGFAIELNTGSADPGEFYWTQYEPMEAE